MATKITSHMGKLVNATLKSETMQRVHVDASGKQVTMMTNHLGVQYYKDNSLPPEDMRRLIESLPSQDTNIVEPLFQNAEKGWQFSVDVEKLKLADKEGVENKVKPDDRNVEFFSTDSNGNTVHIYARLRHLLALAKHSNKQKLTLYMAAKSNVKDGVLLNHLATEWAGGIRVITPVFRSHPDYTYGGYAVNITDSQGNTFTLMDSEDSAKVEKVVEKQEVKQMKTTKETAKTITTADGEKIPAKKAETTAKAAKKTTAKKSAKVEAPTPQPSQFAGLTTMEQVRQRYMELIQQGIEPNMEQYTTAFNAAHDAELKAAQDSGKYIGKLLKEQSPTEGYLEAIDVALQLAKNNGVSVEVSGCYIWISNTKREDMDCRNALKGAGFWWAKNRKQWYWKPDFLKGSKAAAE